MSQLSLNLFCSCGLRHTALRGLACHGPFSAGNKFCIQIQKKVETGEPDFRCQRKGREMEMGVCGRGLRTVYVSVRGFNSVYEMEFVGGSYIDGCVLSCFVIVICDHVL